MNMRISPELAELVGWHDPEVLAEVTMAGFELK